ncbi:MAG: hypothetical protein HYU26_04265 [Candidatus Rokubacteria bacterium]|nr:hypothetical protein [Candidatus Rokubacteria bacterium]
MWCHLLFFGLPVLALPLIWLLPLPLALGVYVPLTALSVWSGLAAIRALQSPPRTGLEAMRGRVARVEVVEGGRIVVRVDNELWSAVAEETLLPGQPAIIVGIDGLTIRVRRPDSS